MKFIRWLGILSLGLFFAFPIFAQTPLPEILSKECRVEGNCDIPEFYNLVARSANFMLAIVGALLLIMFVYGGFWLIISGGNAERVAKAKSVFVGSVIGLILVFGGYTIVNGVIGVLEFGNVSESNRVQSRDTIQKAVEEEQRKATFKRGCCSYQSQGDLPKCENADDEQFCTQKYPTPPYQRNFLGGYYCNGQTGKCEI